MVNRLWSICTSINQTESLAAATTTLRRQAVVGSHASTSLSITWFDGFDGDGDDDDELELRTFEDGCLTKILFLTYTR